jgi:threonine/homoserine/homoserine lactone efflux protein
MLTLSQTLPFLLAAILLTVTPGPDNLMVLATGMARGKRAGMAFGLGCALGCLSHTMLAVIGISAVLAASPTAFLMLKIAGGSYLIWLGVQAFRHAGHADSTLREASDAPPGQLFAKGLLANAINPKVAMFFLSFLPQFVDASQGNLHWQIAGLGLIFTAQAAILFTLAAYCAGMIGNWLKRRPNAGRWLDRAAGTLFIALGLRVIAAR